MADYTQFIPIVVQMRGRVANWQPIVDRLKDTWSQEYLAHRPGGNLVASDMMDYGYLFDAAAQRLVAAWGISGGPAAASGTRLEPGKPAGIGPQYHRRQALARSLAGGTGVNLVPQQGQLNVGAFRALEKMAVENPGSLYFTYWMFGNTPAGSLAPSAVEQGFLAPGYRPDVRRYLN